MTEVKAMLMQDAVHDLVNDWTDVVTINGTYRPVDHEPLLVMLRTAIRSSTGATTPGASEDATRNPFNVQAFDLWQQITRDVHHHTRRLTKDRANPLLGYAIRHLAEHADALWNTDQITEHDYLNLIRKAKGWRTEIWAIFNRPIEAEITEPCPECEQRYVYTADGEQQAALVTTYDRNSQPIARCRNCQTLWSGEAGLIILGKRIGAELDATALSEMGIEVE